MEPCSGVPGASSEGRGGRKPPKGDDDARDRRFAEGPDAPVRALRAAGDDRRPQRQRLPGRSHVRAALTAEVPGREPDMIAKSATLLRRHALAFLVGCAPLASLYGYWPIPAQDPTRESR